MSWLNLLMNRPLLVVVMNGRLALVYVSISSLRVKFIIPSDRGEKDLVHSFRHSWRHVNEIQPANHNCYNDGENRHDCTTSNDESIVRVRKSNPDIQVNC